MSVPLDRRHFLRASALSATSLGAAGWLSSAGPDDAPAGVPIQELRPGEGDEHRGRCVISSGNGMAATARAMELIDQGVDCVDAVVAGVGIVERDPNDMSVGLGGLPDADGQVTLDASVMHGPSHRAGSVGCLIDTVHAAQVALLVLKRTDHVMLVGDRASRFAREHGFPKEDLLTDRARKAWLRWRSSLNSGDDRLDPDQALGTEGELEIPYTTGTIHCGAVDENGDVSATTTTSGLSYKIPGRVGDSPIIGAGMYVDNEVGSAGATGRGEAVIQSCGAFSAVREMESGATPTEACLRVLERIASRTKRSYLLNAKGEPNFNVVMYALRKDGAFGAACMRGSRTFAVHDGEQNRLLRAASLYE